MTLQPAQALEHFQQTVEETNLAPGLLLSMPQLEDPNFKRAVIVMLEHNDEGSFGIIVNHESHLKVSDLLRTLDTAWQGASEDTVWSGGPVMPNSGWVLHSGCDDLAPASASLNSALETSGTAKIIEGLYLSTSEQNLRVLAASPPPDIRFLMGYSGWGPGQLAQEMARGSWLHANIDMDILFDTDAEDMWLRCLKTLGINPETIIQTSGVH